ncbi:FAD/FMN-containing dehydrogenase [Marmoricola sp. URHA0025 HA25]
MTIDHIAIRPGDAEYDAARTIIVGTAEPAVVLRPGDTAEVVAALEYVRAAGLELAIRSGGHNALGFGNSDGGAVIDLSRLDSVEFLGGGKVRIGAGAKWGAAAAALAEHGLAITSGDTVSVGVGGLTQAGGIGWMVRKHGLTIDSVLGAEVVTAGGDVVRADADTNADLFWALRGGAGNFGSVTSFDYQAQPVTTVHFGTLSFALDDVPQLLKSWAATMESAPEELSTALVLMPGFGAFPAGAVLYVAYCGDDASAIDPLRSLGNLQADTVTEKPYAEVLEEAHPPEGIQPVIGNAFVEQLSGDVIDAIATAYSAGTAGRVVFLRSLGGAFGRVATGATAFAHRAAQVLVVSAKFLPLDAPEEAVAAARAEWQTIGRHGIGSYAGFLGSDTAEDLAALYPPETLARLVEAKRSWDPDNVFRRNFNIRP